MPKLHKQPVDRNDLKVFKLVNGQHIGFDYTAEPETVTDQNGDVIGYTYPSKKFDALTNDNYVLSTGDLVTKCVNKFQAEPDWSDAHRRLMAGERVRQRARVGPQAPTRADAMDKADGEVSPHNPPLDEPDVAPVPIFPDNMPTMRDAAAGRADVGKLREAISGAVDQHQKEVEAQRQQSVQKPQQSKPQQTEGKPQQERAQQSKEPPANLSHMTVEQLEQHAKDEEIDLKGAKTKADMIRVIRSSV